MSEQPFDWRPYIGKRVLVTITGNHLFEKLVKDVSPKGNVYWDDGGWSPPNAYRLIEVLLICP